MVKNKAYQYFFPGLSAGNTSAIIAENPGEAETGTLEITGTGEIRIRNTGGSSASEGGMGNDNQGDEKGTLSKPGEKSGGMQKDPDTFDPVKEQAIEETEKRSGKE